MILKVILKMILKMKMILKTIWEVTAQVAPEVTPEVTHIVKLSGKKSIYFTLFFLSMLYCFPSSCVSYNVGYQTRFDDSEIKYVMQRYEKTREEAILYILVIKSFCVRNNIYLKYAKVGQFVGFLEEEKGLLDNLAANANLNQDLIKHKLDLFHSLDGSVMFDLYEIFVPANQAGILKNLASRLSKSVTSAATSAATSAETATNIVKSYVRYSKKPSSLNNGLLSGVCSSLLKVHLSNQNKNVDSLQEGDVFMVEESFNGEKGICLYYVIKKYEYTSPSRESIISQIIMNEIKFLNKCLDYSYPVFVEKLD